MTTGFSDTVLVLGSTTHTAGLLSISNSEPQGSRNTFCARIGAVPLTTEPSDIAGGVSRKPIRTVTVMVLGFTAAEISRTSPTVLIEESVTVATVSPVSKATLASAHS